MPIPHTTYTATIELDVPCLVHCKNCDCRFIYERRFSGSGKADTLWSGSHKRTRKTAETKARDDISEMLSHIDINDPVPCPQCLHYQPYMFPQVGYARYDNLGCVSFAFQFLSFFLFVGAVVYALITGLSTLAYALAAGGAAGMLVGWLLNRRRERLVAAYNPNEEGPFDEQRRIADARAIPLDEYDTRQSARVGRAYEQHRAEPGRREPLVVDWWLPSAVFANGAPLAIALPGGPRFTAEVSDNAAAGDEIDAHPAAPSAGPIRLRLLEMRVHPDELRYE